MNQRILVSCYRKANQDRFNCIKALNRECWLFHAAISILTKNQFYTDSPSTPLLSQQYGSVDQWSNINALHCNLPYIPVLLIAQLLIEKRDLKHPELLLRKTFSLSYESNPLLLEHDTLKFKLCIDLMKCMKWWTFPEIQDTCNSVWKTI